MSPAARRTVTYWVLLLLPTLAVGGAAVLLLRKEQGRLAAQQATAMEARRAAATARAGLIVENVELLVGDIETALLDALAQIPVAGVDDELERWEKSHPLVRKAWRCTPAGRIVHPDPAAGDEESQAFRRRFAPLLESNPPWRARPMESRVAANIVPRDTPAPVMKSEAETARQQAYVNVAKVRKARSDAKQSSSARGAVVDEIAGAAAPASSRMQAEDSGTRREKASIPERRGWSPWLVDGRLHLLGWLERSEAGEVRGVEVELSALIARLGGALPAETQGGEGYLLRDEKGRVMHQAGWIPRNLGAAVVRLPLAEAVLPGWEVAAFLDSPDPASPSASGIFIIGSLLVGTLIAAILAGGSLLFWQAQRSAAEAQQKTSFVANVSHEFKTPLTTIRLYTELLEQGRVPDEARRQEYLQTIGRETERLARLVGNALDFSRLEQGKKRYQRETLDLSADLARLIEIHGPRLAEAGLTLTRNFPESPVTVVTDRDALEQIMLNLLDNAAKYAGAGAEVEIELQSISGGGARVRVLDRGPGVAPGHRERIFEKFHRVDESLTAEKGGTGLGLSIARQLARGLGGDLHYEPRDGGGAAFILRLP